MLVLTRRVGERLIIDHDIVITVKRNRGNQVCIGIDAPSDVSVHREEIYNRIRWANATETDDYWLKKKNLIKN